MTRCRYRLPDPLTAGYTTLEALRAAASRSPDLRPCPRHKGSQGTWNWIDRKHCLRCPDRDATPREVMPSKAIPSDAVSNEGTPLNAIPTSSTPPQAMPPEVTLPEAMPPQATPHEAMPPEVMSPESIPTHPLPSEVTPHV